MSGLKFAIKEVTGFQSPYLDGMNRWLEQIFPEYCPSRFDQLLDRLRKPDGRHRIQIFVALCDHTVAGLAQIFYRQWQGGLLADIDLLGVLEPFRRCGLALALVQHSLQAASEMAQRYALPAIGVVTLIDPTYTPIVQLHQKHGGQTRADCQYPGGDVIAWYPAQPDYKDIATPVLVEQLQQFGRLLEC